MWWNSTVRALDPPKTDFYYTGQICCWFRNLSSYEINMVWSQHSAPRNSPHHLLLQNRIHSAEQNSLASVLKGNPENKGKTPVTAKRLCPSLTTPFFSYYSCVLSSNSKLKTSQNLLQAHYPSCTIKVWNYFLFLNKLSASIYKLLSAEGFYSSTLIY